MIKAMIARQKGVVRLVPVALVELGNGGKWKFFHTLPHNAEDHPQPVTPGSDSRMIFASKARWGNPEVRVFKALAFKSLAHANSLGFELRDGVVEVRPELFAS